MHLVTENRPQVQRDRLLRLPQCEALTGLKKSSIYTLMKRGDFPRCVQLTARCVAWPESTVLQWVQNRINKAQQGAEVQP
ncbi:prophage regulatory protein [Paucibacter oligotrophus]|uniref:Prophage regulatory protein n=1 Tax=Roseateles oligotrophus TaxID=1769250 RepID=A0A840L8E2_9BURK|nr:AlpA family transcriptional regulator [Roseateles oligotrophus]MBB4842488.1 prophage regulatory protein [Roseateles oligotrophus]